MNNKFITWITLVPFTVVSLLLPLPTLSSKVYAQDTSSLRPVVTPAVVAGFSFKKDLMLGDTDPDVKEMQKILNQSADTRVSATGAGSPGQESTYFGALTKSAVIKFQEKYKISNTGYVGKLTRTQLNLLIGVTVTNDSVGLPQSRASAGAGTAVSTPVTTVTPPVIVSQSAASSGSVCQFIELLINIQVIAPAKAAQARSALNCQSGTSPSVDVKANGSDGPITVMAGESFSLSWKSYNTVSCSDGVSQMPTSGKIRLSADKSLSYPVTCTGVNGQKVTDSVVVKAGAEDGDAEISILESSVVPGYDYVNVRVITNVSTKMLMAYSNDPKATSSVKVFESDMSKEHLERITGLTPNSTYYAITSFTDEDGNSVMTSEIVFTTLATEEEGVTQRVLSSAGGVGIVSVPESESLKTNEKMTLEAWVNPTSWSTKLGMSNTSDSVIISKGNIGGNINYALSLDNGKLVYSNNDASLFTCSPVVPLNKWTHVAVTVDESAENISLYVNGSKQNNICEGQRGVFSKTAKIDRANAITEQVESSEDTSSSGGWGSYSAATSSDPVIASNVYFGNFYPQVCGTDFAGNGFIGLIDDVKIWSVARTSAQINTDSKAATSTEIVNSNTFDSPAGLVGHWSFDDGKANDLTFNMNNGDLKGDMLIASDETAKSAVTGDPFGFSAPAFDFAESCDDGLGEDALSGYEITFKGGVQSVRGSGPSTEVTLQTCDNPKEDLVKSVSVIGNAPSRDPSYFNQLGTVMVTIAAGLGMTPPAERDTIQGKAVNYISGPNIMGPANPSVDYIGAASEWTPVKKSCMKPLEEGGLLGNWGVVGAIAMVVVSVVVAAYCPPCYAAMLAYGATATLVTSAGVGYYAGSQIEKEE